MSRRWSGQLMETRTIKEANKSKQTCMQNNPKCHYGWCNVLTLLVRSSFELSCTYPRRGYGYLLSLLLWVSRQVKGLTRRSPPKSISWWIRPGINKYFRKIWATWKPIEFSFFPISITTWQWKNSHTLYTVCWCPGCIKSAGFTEL